MSQSLSKVEVGLGWDPNSGASQFEFDLDATAFMLGSNSKIPADEFFVFWRNLKSPDGSIERSGDDRTGGSSEGDDELLVDFTKIDKKIHQIIFCVSIYEAEARKQNFGQVRNSFVRIYDRTSGREIAKYELEEDFGRERGRVRPPLQA
jgi:tellurium resistance protein TerD